MPAPLTAGPDAGIRRRLVGPVVVGLGGAAAMAAVAVHDPNVPGNWGVDGVGLCPLLALTGLWCPLCGGLRAVHALASFDLAAAVASNVVVVGLVVVAITTWATWLLRELRGRSTRPGRVGPDSVLVRVLESPAAMRLVVIGLLGFTVLRNLPVGSVLAP